MTSPLSFHVGINEFAEKVINASYQQPVMVDFWASWCGPCKLLMPRLEQLCQDYQGRFLLAKVDSDQHRQLVSEYAVSNIPTVLLFKDGQPVERFMGVINDEAIRALLDNQLPGPADEHLQQARAAIQQQQRELALQQIELALGLADALPRIIAEANSLLLEMGEYQLASEHLQKLPIKLEIDPQIAPLRARLSFVPYLDASYSSAQLQELTEREPDNLVLYLKLAAQQVLSGRLEEAMESLLGIIERDPKFQEGVARQQMLKIFEALGNSGELVHKYRLQMAKLLL